MQFARSLIAAWRLENTALDTSGNGRNGVVTGAAYAAGEQGRALDFAGGVTTDRVTVTHHASLNPSAGLTIAARIYPRSPGASTFARLLQKSVTTALANGYGCYCLANKLILNVNNGGSVGFTTALAYNTWQRIGITCTAGGVVLAYLNGAGDGGGNTGALAAITTVGDLTIGNRQNDLARAWDGLIDELSIWNRVLIPADMVRLTLGLSPVA